LLFAPFCDRRLSRAALDSTPDNNGLRRHVANVRRRDSVKADLWPAHSAAIRAAAKFNFSLSQKRRLRFARFRGPRLRKAPRLLVKAALSLAKAREESLN
jgi:hypothetical protein